MVSLQLIAFSAYLVIADIRARTFGVGALVLYFPTKLLLKKAREYMKQSYDYMQESNHEVQRIIENMFLIKLLKKTEKKLINMIILLMSIQVLPENHKYGSINAFLPSFTTMFVLSILLMVGSVAKSLTIDFIYVTFRLFQSVASVTGSVKSDTKLPCSYGKVSRDGKNKISVHKDNFVNTQTDEELC